MRNKSLLVLFNNGLPDERAIKQKMYWLNQILLITESTDQFCRVTELVDRNRITSNKKRIIKETSNFRLKPFRFLINKN
jgi:hypothetical protein